MSNDIKNSKTIGDVPTNSLVHWEGGSFCSGEAHTERIVNACGMHSIPTTRLDLAIFLGVKVDNHNVKVALIS